MKTSLKIILIFLAIFTFVCACSTLIPIQKYQNAYFKFIKDFRNKPQEHFDKEIEYANYVLEHGQTPKTKQIPTKNNHNPATKPTLQVRKPLYIRDKNNPEILYPYKEEYESQPKKMRKFLFFRIYYK